MDFWWWITIILLVLLIITSGIGLIKGFLKWHDNNVLLEDLPTCGVLDVEENSVSLRIDHTKLDFMTPQDVSSFNLGQLYNGSITDVKKSSLSWEFNQQFTLVEIKNLEKNTDYKFRVVVTYVQYASGEAMEEPLFLISPWLDVKTKDLAADNLDELWDQIQSQD